ncbi:hypothetical protein [Streptomyces sp. NPDC059092]|uniref:hypothetical protein n=1 Tax=Streptomyces sp. NPDC059092 TaxID=3346725 RepID=UPI0036B5834C
MKILVRFVGIRAALLAASMPASAASAADLTEAKGHASIETMQVEGVKVDNA